MLEQQRIVAVVEDDPSLLRSIQRLLNASGLGAEVYASAKAFLTGSKATRASCLVLDIHLGGMSGFELQSHLAASGSKLPIIFMTAFGDESKRKHAMEAGCVAYLQKPFSARQLFDTIEKAMG
jgi:FixJ family two-component response regulator